VEALRQQGVKAGLFRPLTLWPFPIRLLEPHLTHVRQLIVVEASNGQLEDELRLALSKAGGAKPVPIESIRRYGGMLPDQAAIVQKALGVNQQLAGVTA
jgi:pyruvate/2-oxoacid:ferredoxin oxidoreductase alpha subunit